MACCGLSPGAALVATVPASSSSPRLSYAPVRLPALRTARSLTLRCARGHGNTAVLPWAPSSYDHDDKCFTRDPDADKEAAVALVDAVAGAFPPLLDNLKQLRSVRTVFDVEDYHVGMPLGALLACVGLWQVWKLDPSTCVDFALACAFYKLSVLAADVRKRGFSNDLITRIQLAVGVTMAFKDIHKSIVPLDYIRVPVFFLYTVSVFSDLSGVKKFVNPLFSFLFALSKTKPGRREVMRMLVFGDFSYIGTLTLCGGGPKMEGVPDAQRVEVKQTLDRLLRLIDEDIESEMKGVLAAQWVICQILARMPRVNDKMIGLKMEGAPDAQPVEVDQTLALVPRVNDEVIGSKMEGVPNVQRVELGQTLAQVPRVNDEVIEQKMEDSTSDAEQVEMSQTLVQMPRMNDKVIGSRMEGVPDVQPDVQRVEVDQTLAQVPRVSDEVTRPESVN